MTSLAPLTLHVPEPAVRPGGTPTFDVEIPEAGSVRRPDVDVSPAEIRDLAYSIIRVLNRDGEAVGPWAGLLSDEELLEGLRHMMTLRAFDARMQMAQRQGKTSFYMQHMGEEAVSCAFRKALEPGDMNFPTYRQAGLLIAGGYPMVDMMYQIYSNERDPLKGRQLPVMYSSKEHGFFSISGNLATQYIQAVGWAMASAIKSDTQDRRRLDRRRLDRRIRLPRRAGLRLDLQGAGRAQHRQQPVGDLDLPGHRARRLGHLRRARPRLRHPGAAGRRQRLSRRPCRGEMGGRARAPQSRADADRIRHLSRRRAFDLRRSVGLPAEDRIRCLAARRSGDPAEEPPDPCAASGRRSATSRRKRRSWTTVIAAQKEAESHGTLHAGGKPSARDMFEGVYAEMPPHLRRQRQQAGV